MSGNGNKTDGVLCRIEKTYGSTPRKAGSEMMVYKDGSIEGSIGGGTLENVCMKKALSLFETKEDYTEHFDLGDGAEGGLGMICGGCADVSFAYVPDVSRQVVKKGERALVFGGGHVGTEVVPVLEHVGFNVWVLDNRAEFANEKRHPKAEKCVVCDYSDIGRSVEVGKGDYVIILTHGHLFDREVLLQVCRTDASYIGCIGSKRKVEMTLNYLRDNGISEEKIKEIHSPIGIELFADTPPEIAISIAAEIIRHRALQGGK